MITEKFSILEANVISSFNEGNKTFESILEKTTINENMLNSILTGLISKNIFKFNNVTKEYEYVTKINGEIIVLDGNIMLPVTIIKQKDKMYISRGEWYEVPLDFDIRRIIWNVKIPTDTKSTTLIDMIRDSILVKTNKTRNVQVAEYQNLQNKVIPYNKNQSLLMEIIGAEETNIVIRFHIEIGSSNEDVKTLFKDFKVKSKVQTSEILEELQKPLNERDYSNIRTNKLFNFSDFIFLNNEIPYQFKDNELLTVKITSIRKVLELSYFKYTKTSKTKVDFEKFTNISLGLKHLKDLFFFGYVNNFLLDIGINVEETE